MSINKLTNDSIGLKMNVHLNVLNDIELWVRKKINEEEVGFKWLIQNVLRSLKWKLKCQ